MMRTTRIVAMVAGAALAVTACGGDDETRPETGSASGAVEVEAGDLYFDPETLSAVAGEIEVTLINVGSAEHDFVIEEANDTEVAYAAPGETVTGSIELVAGTYAFYCSIPGHRAAGMEGTLEVS